MVKEISKEQHGYEYEWNMATYNFERYHVLQQHIDSLISNVRINPQIDEIKALYSCLMTLYNNLHASFIPKIRDQILDDLNTIHEDIIAIEAMPQPSLNYKTIRLFDKVHRDLNFALEQVGLGIPRRKRLGGKEKLRNVI